MTEEERIKWNLRQIARVARDKDYYREWGAGAVLHYIRSVLDHLEKLTQEDEPESLASSVLRLTDLCNKREAENYKLKRTLLLVEGNLMILKKNLDVATRSNAWLRERLSLKDTSLRACRAADAHIVELQGDLARKTRHLERAKARLEWIKLSLEQNPTGAEERVKKLEQEQAANESYIKTLRRDLARKHRLLAQVCNQVKGLQRTLEDTP